MNDGRRSHAEQLSRPISDEDDDEEVEELFFDNRRLSASSNLIGYQSPFGKQVVPIGYDYPEHFHPNIGHNAVKRRASFDDSPEQYFR